MGLLSGSLNPAADEWRRLMRVEQLHFIGAQDQSVPQAVTDAYRARFPSGAQPRLRVLEGFDHRCCWVGAWPALYREPYPEIDEARQGHTGRAFVLPTQSERIR